MKLYIIIPAYQAEKCIRQAIESVINETSSSFETEFFIVNDGSTDSTEKICLNYINTHNNIHYMKQSNQGVSVARNTALFSVYERCTENDLVGFLDADDLWCDDWIKTVSKYITRGDDIIGFGCVKADKQIINNKEYTQCQKIIKGGFETSVAENRKQHFASYLYKASFLKKHNLHFVPGLWNGEDLIFKYQAFLLAETIFYSGEVLYIYRNNPLSVTNNYSLDAKKHYSNLLLGWSELENWANNQLVSCESSKMADFATTHKHDTCIYYVKDYCRWNNGNYLDFVNDAVNEMVRIIGINNSFSNNNNLKEYKLLLSNPRLFYLKYKTEGKIDRIKKFVKNIKAVKINRDK